jgi:uracil-DNA glycosylase
MKEPVLDSLRARAKKCTACPLWRNATQTVFGAGNPHAEMVLVGEQPGDAEDRAGEPFVGPAGAVLDRALKDAGIDREKAYVTNAVKHFKWEPRGKRRIHKTPIQREIDACAQWLEGELAAIRPTLVVALGSTAAKALLGGAVTLRDTRGRIIERSNGFPVLVTVHPSFVLRVPPEGREEAYRGLVSDLQVAAEHLRTLA